MRIIAGTWRGKGLAAPQGVDTRPTGQRMRQAMFDMLMHAPWGGRALVDGALVLDGFAGTGALGLEALSRGAASAIFMDNAPAALAALRVNVAACGAEQRSRIVRADLRQPPPGAPQRLVFLDPPYGQGLLPPAVAALRARGWIGPGTVLVAENGRLEDAGNYGVKLAHKVHGVAQVNVWREA